MTAEEKLDFLKSKGITVGIMKEAGKEPRPMYVVQHDSELDDQHTVDRLVDLEIAFTKVHAALKALLGLPDIYTSARCYQIVNEALDTLDKAREV